MTRRERYLTIFNERFGAYPERLHEFHRTSSKGHDK